MILNTSYYKACDFATKLYPSAPTDLVHDTFVEWYDQRGENIFDEPEQIILLMVRKMFHKRYREKAFVRFTDKVKRTLVTPEDELIEIELGLSFMSYEEIEARVQEYEQYHTIYPKINLN